MKTPNPGIIYLSYRDINSPHTGRPTFEIVEKLSRIGFQVIFFEGIPGENSRIKLIEPGLQLINGERINISHLQRHNVQLKNFYKQLLFQQISKMLENFKPVLIIVDNISELLSAIELGKKFEIPILFRWYGIFDFPERLKLLNYLRLRFKPKTLLKTLFQLHILYKFLNYQYGSKIVITQDGAAIEEFRKRFSQDFKKKILKLRNARPEQALYEFEFNDDSSVNVLYVSRLVALKKPDVVLYAMYFLKKFNKNLFERIRLVIIGDGPMRKKLTHLALKLHLSNHVVFLGYIPNSEIKRMLPRVTLSLSVNSHNPIVESLISGVPVVANDFGEVSELFKNIEGIKLVKTGSVYFNSKKTGKLYAEKIISWFKTFKEMPTVDLTKFIEKIQLATKESFPSISEKVEQEVSIITSLISDNSKLN